MELYQASKQWAERPADERFETLEAMRAASRGYADNAAQSVVPAENIRVETVGEDLRLTGKSGQLAKMTHWSFGQLARIIEAPAEYLRKLPATLAGQNLNHGWAKIKAKSYNLMFHRNGELVLRSATTDSYARFWNWELIDRLIPLQAQGWRVPPARPAFKNQPGTRPATAVDVLAGNQGFGLSIKEGDPIAPAGLYASDHDMFAFMVDDKHPVDSGSGKPMYRGFFAWNSEVGAASLGITTFLYDTVCGNHIVWGATDVKEVRLRHIGNIDHKSRYKFQAELRRYSESSVGDIELKIARARKTEIAGTKEGVLDALFGKRITSRKNLDASYDLAEKFETVHGAPNTVWGMASGLTRLSQETRYADERAELDRAAGKILETIEF